MGGKKSKPDLPHEVHLKTAEHYFIKPYIYIGIVSRAEGFSHRCF